MQLTLGTMTAPISGNITQLNALILADNLRTETNLGFHAGRLASGYFILVLKTLPQPSQFEFDGTTLRSGGRLGLPASTQAEDSQRARVHDQIAAERGASGYSDLQRASLGNVAVLGPKRLVKVLPDTLHDPNMPPDKQYPAGGGFLQWKLKQPGLSFYVAAHVGSDGVAKVPHDSFALNTGDFGQDYGRRAKFQQYLQNA